MHEFETIVALGDPQTTLDRVRAVLSHHDLLTAAGRLRDEVHLVVLGDYFDFGAAEERHNSAREGLSVLQFFAEHPKEQVTLIAGNHDLARVGEFITMTDERFTEAVTEAGPLYRGPEGHDERFLGRFPEFPSVEVVARDFSSYVTEQRDWVLRLLDERRLRLAAAFEELLFCHAGVTYDDLEVAGLGGPDVTASEAATFLNGALDAAWGSWSRDVPFQIPGLHVPGSAVAGEGGGVLFHRPCEPSIDPSEFAGPHRRRFDPRNIPKGVVQVVGHVRDAKCRKLMPTWAADASPDREGALRSLWTDGQDVEYRVGMSPLPKGSGGIFFLDGGIHHVPPEDYEILDVRARRSRRRASL